MLLPHELPEDDVDRLVIYIPDERVWQVPSRSEGHFRTVDTLLHDGVTILCCDCPGNFYMRQPCHHVKLVARWIAAHGDQGNMKRTSPGRPELTDINL